MLQRIYDRNRYAKIKQEKQLAELNAIIQVGLQTEDEAKAWSQMQQVVGRMVIENRELREQVQALEFRVMAMKESQGSVPVTLD
eukprot:symbB.v1.2.005630.t1/scaffold309.1/size276354/11